MNKGHYLTAVAAMFFAAQANAAHERFHQDAQSPKSGFFAATDPLYTKECGSCHFPYSPGLMPARSWENHINKLDKHFGENVDLPAATKEALRKYLTDNAADKSSYEGSEIFLQRLKAESTPYSLQQVPKFHQAHATIVETISVKPRIKVRTLANCSACHVRAAEGSYNSSEVDVPGLERKGAIR